MTRACLHTNHGAAHNRSACAASSTAAPPACARRQPWLHRSSADAAPVRKHAAMTAKNTTTAERERNRPMSCAANGGDRQGDRHTPEKPFHHRTVAKTVEIDHPSCQISRTHHCREKSEYCQEAIVSRNCCTVIAPNWNTTSLLRYGGLAMCRRSTCPSLQGCPP